MYSGPDKLSALYPGNDSPRLRFAGRPSLQLRWKEGENSFLFIAPLCAKRREGQTSAAMLG